MKILARGVVGVLLLALVGAADIPRLSFADGEGNVAFSRDLPIRLGAEGVYFSCHVGLFGEPGSTHEWKIRHSVGGVWSVQLIIQAVSVSDGEDGGAFEVQVTDEQGARTTIINGIAGRLADASISLTLRGRTTYDVRVVRLGDRPAIGTVHHYRLGSNDAGVEIGWRDPMRYLEPRSEWAFHAAPGEAPRLVLFADEPGEEPIGHAAKVTVEVFRPDGQIEFQPTEFTSLPAVITLAPTSGRTFIVKTAADGHLRMRKETGPDVGFYGMPCGQLAGAPPPDAAGAVDPGRQVAAAGNGFERVVAIGGGIAGVLALTLVGAGGWYWMANRPRPPREARLEDTASSDPTATLAGTGNGRAPSDVLTEREREVVALIAEGLTNRQIAERLVISQGTAKRHVENILQKLGLESRSQVAVWAARHLVHR